MKCPVQRKLPRQEASLGAGRGLAPLDRVRRSICEFAARRGYLLARASARSARARSVAGSCSAIPTETLVIGAERMGNSQLFRKKSVGPLARTLSGSDRQVEPLLFWQLCPPSEQILHVSASPDSRHHLLLALAAPQDGGDKLAPLV